MLDGEGKVDGVEPRDPLIRFELVVGELKENKLGVGVDETDDKSKFPDVPTESPALELFLSPAFSEIDSFGTPNDRVLQLKPSKTSVLLENLATHNKYHLETDSPFIIGR